MEVENIKKIKYHEVPLNDGKFALMDKKEFEKWSVGSPDDAITKATGLIDYITFEYNNKNYAVPEPKFELFTQKLKSNEI